MRVFKVERLVCCEVHFAQPGSLLNPVCWLAVADEARTSSSREVQDIWLLFSGDLGVCA